MKKLAGKKLTNKLDKAVRDLYHLKHPNPTCFVCSSNHGWYHPKDNKLGCQIGHYISRRYFAVRWDTKNIFPQCSRDNITHNRNPAPFTNAILNKYGQRRLTYLEEKCKDYTKMSTAEKLAILEKLEAEIAELDNPSVK